MYPRDSGRDPVGCVIFRTLSAQDTKDFLTDACFNLDDCKGLCCRRDADGNTSLIINEVVLFARSHVLLDNQASVNVFCNADLLTDVRRSKYGILLNGVQADACSPDWK